MFYQPIEKRAFIDLCYKDFRQAKKHVNFKEIRKNMLSLGWNWFFCGRDGTNLERVPSVAELKALVEDLFANVIKEVSEEFPSPGQYYCTTGGFHVELSPIALAPGKDTATLWGVRIFFNLDDAENEEMLS